ALLGGISTQGTGRFERSIEMAQQQIAVRPDLSVGYGNLALSYWLLDRFPEAESTLQGASEHKAGSPNLLVLRYNIAAIKGDRETMDQVMTLAKNKPEVEHKMAHMEALTLARSGRLRAAKLVSSGAVDLVLQEGEGAHEEAATYQAARAVWEA